MNKICIKPGFLILTSETFNTEQPSRNKSKTLNTEERRKQRIARDRRNAVRNTKAKESRSQPRGDAGGHEREGKANRRRGTTTAQLALLQ
jgi:hypothetical protein